MPLYALSLRGGYFRLICCAAAYDMSCHDDGRRLPLPPQSSSRATFVCRSAYAAERRLMPRYAADSSYHFRRH